LKADACAARFDLSPLANRRGWRGVIAKVVESTAARPFSVFVAFECTAYTVTKGEITKFDSIPGKTQRGFCVRCGSTLTCETVGLPTLTDFHVGAFDHPEHFHPTKHIFPEERLPWLHLVDT
jgi:hypothetical protein